MPIGGPWGSLGRLLVLVIASGLFQCSTWGPLSTPLYSKIHAAVVHVYRVATKNLFCPANVNFMFSDVDLIVKYGLVSPMVMIRQSRLALLARLADKSPHCVIRLLSSFWDRDLGGFRLCEVIWFGFRALVISATRFALAFLPLSMPSPRLPNRLCARFVNILLPSLPIMMSPCHSPLSPLLCSSTPSARFVASASTPFRSLPYIKRLSMGIVTLSTDWSTRSGAPFVCFSFMTGSDYLII